MPEARPRQGACRALVAAFCAGAAWTVAAEPATVGGPDWEALERVGVIDIVTHDADGAVRDRPIWFVAVEGDVYLRTHGSAWLANLQRDPDMVLRIEGVEYPLRAVEVDSAAVREEVDAASAAKYGWQEQFVRVFRRGPAAVLRVESRAADP